MLRFFGWDCLKDPGVIVYPILHQEVLDFIISLLVIIFLKSSFFIFNRSSTLDSFSSRILKLLVADMLRNSTCGCFNHPWNLFYCYLTLLVVLICAIMHLSRILNFWLVVDIGLLQKMRYTMFFCTSICSKAVLCSAAEENAWSSGSCFSMPLSSLPIP